MKPGPREVVSSDCWGSTDERYPMMTMASKTLPLVGLIFISMAIFHLVAVLRDKSKTNGGTNISNKVRVKLAVIFMIVGMALFGFSVFTC